MEIRILLDPKAANAVYVRTDLQTELDALASRPRTTVTSGTIQPEGELDAGAIVQFVVNHSGEIAASLTILAGTIKVGGAILDRFGITTPKKKAPAQPRTKKRKKVMPPPPPPPMEIVVGKHRLALPASGAKAQAFLKAVEESSRTNSQPAK